MNFFTFLKGVSTPGSLGFLVICLGVGLTLRAWPRRRRLSNRWLFAVAAIYWILATPAVANGIANRLPAMKSPEPIGKLDTLFVLDGDNRRGRERETLRAFQDGHPSSILLLSDSWLVDKLLGDGLPSEIIHQIPNTANTYGQMAKVGEYLRDHSTQRTGLIASRLQMPRIERLAQAAGISTALLPSPIDIEPPTSGLGRWIPSYYALRVSRDAIYEHVALRYYRLRGRIR